jgi:hypothetical protein
MTDTAHRQHDVKYERSTLKTWLWRAKCSCHWCEAGEREQVVKAVTAHLSGNEWVEADPYDVKGHHHLDQQTTVPCATDAAAQSGQ